VLPVSRAFHDEQPSNNQKLSQRRKKFTSTSNRISNASKRSLYPLVLCFFAASICSGVKFSFHTWFTMLETVSNQNCVELLIAQGCECIYPNFELSMLSAAIQSKIVDSIVNFFTKPPHLAKVNGHNHNCIHNCLGIDCNVQQINLFRVPS
jgi:hypothetical protein